MKRLFSLHPLILCGALWCILIAVVLLTRPLLTTIETRAMTVAWEMHVRHDFLVPTLNFKPYTQKPPLLAWLINLGWLLVGYHRFMATLIASAFGFSCVAWTYAIARRLWPADLQRASTAAWLCFGAAVMQIYGTLIFYDIMLTSFVLGSICMLLCSIQTRQIRYTIGLGIFLGLAGLSKGPVVLVHILPFALLAPLWHPNTTVAWSRWYLKIVLAVVIGCAIGFGWAIPAALQGGHDYAKWILMQQTTKRVVKAFNHEEAWWYYFAVGPILFLPWLFLPAFWQNLKQLRTAKTDMTLRFLMCWIIPVFIIFSLISGKQLHYLLPLWPALSLLLAYILPTTLSQRNLTVPAMPFLLFGIVWSIVVILLRTNILSLHHMWSDILLPYPWLPALYTVCIALLLAYSRHTSHHKIAAISLMMCMTVTVIHITGAPQGFNRFSAEPVAEALLARSNRPIAVVSARYQGDVNFLNRITQPLTIIPLDHEQALADFFKKHPDGIVLQQTRNTYVFQDYNVIFQQPARAKRLYVLTEKKQP